MTAAARRAEVLALIPARGGSKGIPRKNLVPLAGRPLIAHTIGQALASRRITRVVVSTDDEEIAGVARGFGAEVPFRRPAALAADLSPDVDVFRHALAWLRDHEGYACEAVAHLRPTGPVRRVELIDLAIDTLLADGSADSLRSVSRAAQSPYKMWRLDGARLVPVTSAPGVAESHSRPRQALPDVFWQNGYVDVIRPGVIVERGLMAGDRVLPFVIEEPVIEIDYPDSLEEAERALRALEDGRWPPPGPAAARHAV